MTHAHETENFHPLGEHLLGFFLVVSNLSKHGNTSALMLSTRMLSHSYSPALFRWWKVQYFDLSVLKCRWAKCDMLQLSLENVHFPHCNCCPNVVFDYFMDPAIIGISKFQLETVLFFQQITARQITANRWWLKAAIPAIRFACPPHEFVSKFSWAYHESSQLGEFIFGRFYYGHAPSMKSCQRIQSQSFTHPAFSARKQDVHFFKIFAIDIYLQHYKWNRRSVTVPIPLKRIHKRRYWGYLDGLDFLITNNR